MFTKEQRREALADKIESIRKERGSTKTHVYTAANMSYLTYDRKLSGQSEFTFAELIDIANALGVSVSSLVEVTEEAQAA